MGRSETVQYNIGNDGLETVCKGISSGLLLNFDWVYTDECIA